LYDSPDPGLKSEALIDPANSVVSVLLLTIAVIFGVKINQKNKENFDAIGMYYNVPPNWFIKADYNPSNWIVRSFPEQIQPECMSYSRAAKYGSLENLNYLLMGN